MAKRLPEPLRAYRLLTALAAPLLPLWLLLRTARGKEDWPRLTERFGSASLKRPTGRLAWLHAASVGEATSVLPLIEALRARYPGVTLLLTTGTVTSAKLMRARLPAGVIHQYVPVDTPAATERFIRHWRPDIAFWVESELWPNLMLAARAHHCYMGLINARMSERSQRRWRRHPGVIGALLGCFDLVIAQSEEDGARLSALGAADMQCYGNLKYDAPALPCDEGELLALKTAIGARPVWLAASTHSGEEAMVAQAHALLSATRPNLLTILAPRHPGRGAAIRQALAAHKATLRSQAPLEPATAIYIADTLGELGLFYRLSEIAFMGGSLVNHGGQNPLEPARLSCAIVSGPHTQNFADIYRQLEAVGGMARVQNAQSLAAQVDRLLNQPPARHAMQRAALEWVEGQQGALARLLPAIAPLFEAAP